MKTVWMLLLAVLSACSAIGGKVDGPYQVAAADRATWKSVEGAVAQIDATFEAHRKPEIAADAATGGRAVEDAMERAGAAIQRERLEFDEADELQRQLRALRKAAGASLTRRMGDTATFTLSQQDIAALGASGKTIEDSTRGLEGRLQAFLDEHERKVTRNVKVAVRVALETNKFLGGKDPGLDRTVVALLELLDATLAKAIETRSISVDTFDASRMSKTLATQLGRDWKAEYELVVQGVLVALANEIPDEGRLEGKNLLLATYVNRGVTEVLTELRPGGTPTAAKNP